MSHGRVPAIAAFIDTMAEDIPVVAAKLTTEQRQWRQHFLRAKMEDLLEAFDDNSR